MDSVIGLNFTPNADEIEAFDEKANIIFETFLESMQGDDRYVRPPEEDEKWLAEEEGFDYLYTQEASRLIDRMLDRLGALAVKKFGARAIDIDIQSHLFREA